MKAVRSEEFMKFLELCEGEHMRLFRKRLFEKGCGHFTLHCPKCDAARKIRVASARTLEGILSESQKEFLDFLERCDGRHREIFRQTIGRNGEGQGSFTIHCERCGVRRTYRSVRHETP